MKAHTIWLMLIAMTSAHGSQSWPGFKYEGGVLGGIKTIPAATDVCKTPIDGAPAPIPYPNVVSQLRSDFPVGTKVKVAGGGQLQVLETPSAKFADEAGNEAGTLQALASIVYVDQSGKAVKFEKSRLIKLANGSYCAVCVNKYGSVTAVLRLAPEVR